MKKTILITGLLALGSVNATATDFIKGGYYGGVAMAGEFIDSQTDYDTGIALVLSAGKPLMKLGIGTLGVEVEMSYTVSPSEATVSDNDVYDAGVYSYSISSEVTGFSLGAYATYTYDINNQLYTRGKLGLAYHNYTGDITYSQEGKQYDAYDYNYNTSVDESGISIAASIGLGMKLNDKINLYSDFIILDNSLVSQFKVGMQMKF